MHMTIRLQPVKKHEPGAIWKPGVVMATKEERRYLGRFARFMADVMSMRLEEAIDRQSYIYNNYKNWEPLSIEYYKYKERKNLSLKIWEATSLLKNNITYWRSDNNWVVGVPRNIYYEDTGVRVHTVVRWMEYGTIKMPARPLFRPVRDRLSKDIRMYWERFKKMEGIKV